MMLRRTDRLFLATLCPLVSGWFSIEPTHAAVVEDYTNAGDRLDGDFFLGHWNNSSYNLQTERHLSSSAPPAAVGGLQPFWLAGEAKVLASDIAFGFYKEHLEGSGATGTSADEVAAISDLLLRWWVPGLVGCLFRESADAYPRTTQLKGQGIGLEDCIFPRELVAKCPWFRASSTASFVVTPLLLAAKFPNRKWYVLADCDTIMNPLALAQFLETYSPDEDWYIGSRSENTGTRRSQGWDVASTGAGVVLSGHLLEPSVALLARCFDAASWNKSPSGAWVLHRCLGRLGVPLTAVAGFKAMDEKHSVFLRHLMEAPPVGGGFLSVKVKQKSGLFAHGSRISEAAFFASLFRDPIALGASCVCEVRVGGRAGLYTATVSAGLSVRLWPGRLTSQLWDFTRNEAISPPPGVKAKKTVFENTGETLIRYAYSAWQPPLVRASTIPSVYLPEKYVVTHSGESEGSAEQWRGRRRRRRLGAGRERYPWIAVVVVEEISKEGLPLLVGARRGLCHLATHEVVFTGGTAGDSGPVLVLRLRDCAHQHAPPSNEKKEILGGLAGSALANLIHQDGGGPANTYTGMRERNLGAFQPAFLGIPVVESVRRSRRSRSRRQRRLQMHESSNDNNGTAALVDGALNDAMSLIKENEFGRRLGSAAEATINPSDCTWVAWKSKMVCGATDGKGHTHTVASTPKGKAPWHGSASSQQQQHAFDDASSGPESWVSKGGASIATMPEANLVASEASSSWLSNKAPLQDEYKFAVSNMAFGIISSAATVSQRLQLLKLWWLPGAQGCLSLDKHVSATTLGHLLPPGLDVCGVPWHIQKKAWMKQGVKGRGLHRGAILHLILHGRFALKKWYVVGDDDTLFNPLALAQYLSAYDASLSWYFGGRSEMMDTRNHIGWDMAFGGGGIVLSGGFMLGFGEALERCFDDAPWFGAPGGDWVLAKCVGRLGVPLTQGGGFHQFDEGGPNMIRDAIERHPVAPFLSVHHESRVFKPGASPLPNKLPFFQSLWRDPIGFGQLAICEVVGTTGNDNFHWVVAVTSGLSVRVHKGGSTSARELLWADTLSRAEIMQPPLLDMAKAESGSSRYALLLDRSTGAPFAPNFSEEGSNIRVYAPDGSGEHPYKLIVVIEEVWKGRWVGAPRRLCHASTQEIRPSRAKSATLVLGAASPTVLVLGLRDCRADSRQVSRLLTREALITLLAKASAPAAPTIDASASFTELPTSFENLAKGIF